ncbi:major facilitator superfamily domain-containing protein [Aspergillus granulosus]|uniref:Major facilitator superfamily domain-containing protein n=1 Tax=Aspergillus granulosus TaxID=176169 RepID=A0ABR4HN11_9EURO
MSDKDANAYHLEEAEQQTAPATSTQDWSDAEERALVRRIDWHVLPVLCVVFALSLLDRTNISSAYIAGMSQDLELTIGVRSHHCLGRMCARNGIRPTLVFPGAVFIISSWYRTYETARRISIFYMASLFASGFGGIIAYGLSLIRVGDGIYRQGWRWIFIIEGAVTIAAGFIAIFTLGQFPEKASWLNDREKQIALTRIANQHSGQEYEHITFKQSLVYLMDWKLGFYALQYFICASSVYSLAFFMPIILREGMGFTYALAQVLTSPPYLVAVVLSLLMAWISDKFRVRWIVLCVQSVTAIVGLLITLYATPPGVRYFGTFLAVFGTQANVPATLAYGQNQTAQPVRKGVVSAAMIAVGAAGGVTGSTIFRAQDAPMYLPGMWSTIAMQMLYTIGTFCMSMYLQRRNRLADEGQVSALEGVEGFRYAP